MVYYALNGSVWSLQFSPASLGARVFLRLVLFVELPLFFMLKGVHEMKTRTSLIIMLYAILTYFAGFFLYKTINNLTVNPDGDVYSFISFSLMYLGASLFSASAISLLLGGFTRGKGVSLWVFLGIFIAEIAFISYYMYFQWQSFHSFDQQRYLPL